MNQYTNEQIFKAFKATFPKLFCRPGVEFSGDPACIIWTGGDNFLDLVDPADPYSTPALLRSWAYAHSCFFEPYDSETWMLYRT